MNFTFHTGHVAFIFLHHRLITEHFFLLACDAGLSIHKLLCEVLRLGELLGQTACVAVEITDLANEVCKLSLYLLDCVRLSLNLFREVLVDQLCLF